MYKNLLAFFTEYGFDELFRHRLADQILEVFQTEPVSDYQNVHSKIWRILTDNEILTKDRHSIIDKLMDLFFQTKQPQSFTPIVPDETLEQWLGEEPEPPMNELERTKKQIEALQQQLEMLERREAMKEPWERAFRDVYGHFPITDSMSGSDWHNATQQGFQKGYEYQMKDNVKECPEETPKPGTLYSICREWCDDENNPPVSELISRIEKEWIPKKTEGIISNLTIGYDNCISEMFNKLR